MRQNIIGYYIRNTGLHVVVCANSFGAISSPNLCTTIGASQLRGTQQGRQAGTSHESLVKYFALQADARVRGRATCANAGALVSIYVAYLSFFASPGLVDPGSDQC